MTEGTEPVELPHPPVPTKPEAPKEPPRKTIDYVVTLTVFSGSPMPAVAVSGDGVGVKQAMDACLLAAQQIWSGVVLNPVPAEAPAGSAGESEKKGEPK